MVFVQSFWRKFFPSCRSEGRYALRLEISATNPKVDRQTQISHPSRHYLVCKLLTYAYWRPTITPYLPKYIHVRQRGTEGGRSDNQKEIER
jgi:hypothetical protein